MHEVHMDEQRDQECGNIHAGIAASPECKEWFQHNGSYTANGLLRFLRKCNEKNQEFDVSKLQGHWYFDPSKRQTLDYKNAPGVPPECK